MIIQVIIPPIPAELIVLDAASRNGILFTTLIAGSGLFLGSTLVFLFSFKLRSFFKLDKVKVIEDKFQKYGVWILLIRVLPYNPSDIISYAAGILKFDKKKYIFITFFTSYIRVFLLSLLGVTISSLFQLALIFFILFLSGVFISYYLYKKK
jgi:uncharacterized membrane protein YdjX (TVP38/TMEM64 family)